MNRDFEFRQLLRAYRMGVISEATFELEMANLESASAGGASNGGGFRTMGKMYPSERAAVAHLGIAHLAGGGGDERRVLTQHR